MSKDKCGALAPFRTCSKGPKTRHKCGEPHKRTGTGLHTIHICKHCHAPFSDGDR